MIELNYRTLAGCLAVALVMICLCGMLMSAGCVTAAKTTYRNAMATPTPTPAPVIPTAIPTPKPTPGPVVTASNQYMIDNYGGFREGDWLTWHRENVSGLKDMTVHVTVYGHRFESLYHWWSVSWGQYFIERPKPGMKFLFIYVNMWMEDASDPRMYGMEENHFWVQTDKTQTGENLTEPDPTYDKLTRIQELDEVWNLNHVEGIKPYGYIRTIDYKGYQQLEPLGYLRAGKSNAWDGFIIFQVPRETKVENIKVIGMFENLGGDAWWQLE